MRSWWLTFTGPEGEFLGAAAVETLDSGNVVEAMLVASYRGCNPGGHVEGHEIPAVLVPKFEQRLPRERWGVLLQQDELEKRELIQRSH